MFGRKTAPKKQGFHVVVSLSALMLGETMGHIVKKWNNTFNHMKRRVTGLHWHIFFRSYFLIVLLSHFVSLFLLAFLFAFLPLCAQTHTLSMKMGTNIKRELIKIFSLHTPKHIHKLLMLNYTTANSKKACHLN